MPVPNGHQIWYLPRAINAGPSLWASGVFPLILTEDKSANDDSTVVQLSNGGTVVRTYRPYQVTGSDDDETAYGWAMHPDDLGSSQTLQRVFPEGAWQFRAQVYYSVPFTTETRNIVVSLYRVGPAPARTRTLIQSVTQTMPLVSGSLISVALAMPELVMAPDESIQCSCEAVAGGFVTGRNLTFRATHTAAGQNTGIITTPIETFALGRGSAVSTSSALASGSEVLGASGNSQGTAQALGAAAATAGSAGDSAGSAQAAASFSAIAGSKGESAGIAAAEASGSRVLGSAGSATVGQGGGGEPQIIVRNKPIYIPLED